MITAENKINELICCLNAGYPVTAADLATDLGVTRAQVRALIEESRRRGWGVLGAPGGGYLLDRKSYLRAVKEFS